MEARTDLVQHDLSCRNNLGLLSRFSLFKVRIDSDKCNSCGLCATKCKAACINSKEHTIDYGRCVDCFDCLGVCKQKALIYQPSLSPTDSSKRRFLVAGLLTAGAVPKLLSQVKESVASLGGKKVYKKRIRLLRRGLSAVNIFSSNVHRAIFVSANAHRMY